MSSEFDFDFEKNQQNPFASPTTSYTVAEDLGQPDSDLDSGPFNPFLSIWLSPRITIRRIIARDPNMYVIPLACVAGIGEVLDQASRKDLGDTVSLPIILAMAVVLGPISGLIQLFIGSFLLKLTGSWFGGVASSAKLRTAIAWANVPAITAMIFWIPLLGLFGSEMFTMFAPTIDAQPLYGFLLLGIAAVEFVLAIWGIFLISNTVAEVHRFSSAWGGLGIIILSGIIAFVAVLAIIVPFVFLSLAAAG